MAFAAEGAGLPDPGDPTGSAEALTDTERQLRILVDGVTDYAIFMLDTTGHVANWNTGAQRIMGYSADEIIGRIFSVLHRGGATRRRARSGARNGGEDR